MEEKKKGKFIIITFFYVAVEMGKKKRHIYLIGFAVEMAYKAVEMA